MFSAQYGIPYRLHFRHYDDYISLLNLYYGFYLFFAVVIRPNAGHDLIILEVFWITHNDAPQSIGLL
jgi:hypothetical protein